jgi:bifunctional DNA-binding transcriptional regulator/antitoxin component of YhaV-PrlF toxin-antitoxin module
MLPTMPNLRLHDHGWLALPAELRKQLDLRTGDRLQIELIEGGLRLRLTSQATTAEIMQPVPLQAVPDEPAAKLGRGRPRKQVPTDLPVVEPPTELPLQPVKGRTEEEAFNAAATGKRASRGLFSGLKIGGRRKSEPAGAA